VASYRQPNRVIMKMFIHQTSYQDLTSRQSICKIKLLQAQIDSEVEKFRANSSQNFIVNKMQPVQELGAVSEAEELVAVYKEPNRIIGEIFLHPTSYQDQVSRQAICKIQIFQAQINATVEKYRANFGKTKTI